RRRSSTEGANGTGSTTRTLGGGCETSLGPLGWWRSTRQSLMRRMPVWERTYSEDSEATVDVDAARPTPGCDRPDDGASALGNAEPDGFGAGAARGERSVDEEGDVLAPDACLENPLGRFKGVADVMPRSRRRAYLEGASLRPADTRATGQKGVMDNL